MAQLLVKGDTETVQAHVDLDEIPQDVALAMVTAKKRKRNEQAVGCSSKEGKLLQKS